MDHDGDKQRIKVHLLKTKSIPNDNYEDHFAEAVGYNFSTTFIPVLEHRFRQQVLDNFPCSPAGLDAACNGVIVDAQRQEHSDKSIRYGGIIFTSQRAVEAFAQVVERVRLKSVENRDRDDSERPQDAFLADYIFRDQPVLYVVGPATARSLRALNLPCEILGEETGNGEALAKFMLEDFNDRQLKRWKGANGSKPGLLFLVGEQRRDIIPKSLQSTELPSDRRIQVDELVVYETVEMASFQTNFLKVWQDNAADIQWIVVFSPQGCKAMLRTIGMIDDSTGRAVEGQDLGEGRSKTYIATIGPTTRDYLRREFGVEPDACAAKPSPEGVGEAIQAFMKSL